MGEIGYKECSYCDGTGESKVYDINIKLEKFADDAEKEFSELITDLKLYEKILSYDKPYIKSWWNKYSDDKQDVKSIMLETSVKKSTTITSEIIKTISDKYYEYEFYYDGNGNLHLTVEKLI